MRLIIRSPALGREFSPSTSFTKSLLGIFGPHIRHMFKLICHITYVGRTPYHSIFNDLSYKKSGPWIPILDTLFALRIGDRPYSFPYIWNMQENIAHNAAISNHWNTKVIRSVLPIIYRQYVKFCWFFKFQEVTLATLVWVYTVYRPDDDG